MNQLTVNSEQLVGEANLGVDFLPQTLLLWEHPKCVKILFVIASETTQ